MNIYEYNALFLWYVCKHLFRKIYIILTMKVLIEIKYSVGKERKDSCEFKQYKNTCYIK